MHANVVGAKCCGMLCPAMRQWPAPWCFLAAAVAGSLAPIATGSAKAIAAHHAAGPSKVTEQDCLNCEQAVQSLLNRHRQCSADVLSAGQNQDKRVKAYKQYVAQWKAKANDVKTGEEACEGHDYNEGQCNNVGCCLFNGTACRSSVGASKCQVPRSQLRKQLEAEVKELHNEKDKLMQEVMVHAVTIGENSAALSELKASTKHREMRQTPRQVQFLAHSKVLRSSPNEEDSEGANFWSPREAQARPTESSEDDEQGSNFWAFHGVKVSRSKDKLESRMSSSVKDSSSKTIASTRATDFAVASANTTANKTANTTGLVWPANSSDFLGRWLACVDNRTSEQQALKMCLSEYRDTLEMNANREKTYFKQVKNTIVKDMEADETIWALKDEKQRLVDDIKKTQRRLEVLDEKSRALR